MNPSSSLSLRVVAALVALVVATMYFYRSNELPVPHGDERGFLDVPYRFATFGDLRYPVFMSDSFEASVLRPYPPIAALAMRSLVLRGIGFSAGNSRGFSAALVLIVLMAAGAWLRSRFDLSWSMTVLALSAASLSPVMVIAARSTRLEQETFFFGALSAVLLAGGGRQGLTRSRGRLLVAGALASFAAGMHPFGVVYGGLAGLVLLASRRFKDLGSWLAGAAAGATPTVWWMIAKGHNLLAFAAANGAMYQAREKDLSEWLAQFGSVSWLRTLGLPQNLLAHLASVQHSSFTDYLDFPMAPGIFSIILRGLFWMEAFVVAGFLVSHLRFRREENDGTAWFCLLALGFLLFTFAYVPNTTYGVYGAFHVHVAFAAVCLEGVGARGWRPRVLYGASAALLAFGLLSISRLLSAPPALALDQEMQAIAEVARAAGITAEETVMTSTESWIAAGSRNTSLQERIQYGLGNSVHSGLVYRRSYAEFYLNAGLPRDPLAKAAAEKTRATAFSGILSGLHLTGLLIIDEAQKDAVYFFHRGDSDTVMVASLDPRLNLPLQRVRMGNGNLPGTRVECDDQPLPLCGFHEH